jgi:hypothetical protein
MLIAISATVCWHVDDGAPALNGAAALNRLRWRDDDGSVLTLTITVSALRGIRRELLTLRRNEIAATRRWLEQVRSS